jgi:hypothetical protein
MLLGLGALFGVFAAAAARFPGHANLLVTTLALIAVCGFDPYNSAGTGCGSGGMVAEASTQLATYGAFPFLVGYFILHRFEFLVVILLAHSVRGAVCVSVCVCACVCVCVRVARGLCVRYATF